MMDSSSVEDRNPDLPLVGCVLVNWNGWQDTLACLASLLQQDYPRLQIFVVDNGSTNDSVARIGAAYPQIELLATGKNLGFAKGTNVGLRRCLALDVDLFWVLNNDTVAPPATCSALVAKATSNPGAGVVGSVLYYLHDPTRVQAWGGGELTPWLARSRHFTAPALLGRNSYLTFASVLIRREVLLKVGLLYEGFFMYYDDADYALRVTRAGYSMAVAEGTAVLHKEGGSVKARRAAIVDRYAVAAGLHFLRRHSPVPWLGMPVFLLLKLGKRVALREWPNAKAVVQGVADYRRQRRQDFHRSLPSHPDPAN